MRVDDIARTERHFTSGLLMHLLLADNFAGVCELLGLLTTRGILPPGAVAWPIAADSVQVIAELAIIRDLLKLPAGVGPAPESDTPRDVIDVVIIIGGLLIAIEAKFFSPTNPPAIRDQLATQLGVVSWLRKHYPGTAITRVCQVFLTADSTVDAGQIWPRSRPEIRAAGRLSNVTVTRVRDEPAGLREPTDVSLEGVLDTDVGVLSWMDITAMAESLLGVDSYVARRLRSALDRYATEFAGGETGTNFTGTEGLDAVMRRCQREGARVVIGYAGGEGALRARPWEDLRERRFKWDWASGGVGTKIRKNWLPGDRFAAVITDLEERARNAPPMAEPAVPLEETDITPARIDELLRFLPLLGTPDERLEPDWQGLTDEPDEHGVRTMPHLTYPSEVEEFFRLAAQPWWTDRAYDPEVVAELVYSDAAIAWATLTQLRAMLTYCVRGERFGDGHWGAMVREGRIGAILRRLTHLRDEMSGDYPRPAEPA